LRSARNHRAMPPARARTRTLPAHEGHDLLDRAVSGPGVAQECSPIRRRRGGLRNRHRHGHPARRPGFSEESLQQRNSAPPSALDGPSPGWSPLWIGTRLIGGKSRRDKSPGSRSGSCRTRSLSRRSSSRRVRVATKSSAARDRDTLFRTSRVNDWGQALSRALTPRLARPLPGFASPAGLARR
jgi:hypothetical protein